MTDFTALYQKHAPEVFRFALYLSGNRGEAEDITSETFVRAWTSSAHIEMATLRGYLFIFPVQGTRHWLMTMHQCAKDFFLESLNFPLFSFSNYPAG